MAKRRKKGEDYELKTTQVLRQILKLRGFENVTVTHDVDVPSVVPGLKRQIDVAANYREDKQREVTNLAVEAKDDRR